MRRGQLDDVVSKQTNLSCKTTAINNLWSQENSHRHRHAQHDVILRFIMSSEQHGSDCDSELFVKFHNTVTIEH